jgi:hypothetical protein
MYDFYLGGSHNFAADRDAARAVLAAIPEAGVGAQANRAFLRRVVRHLADAGVRQFLDLGSGIPTLGNVHEIAQRAAPGAKVVYVDVDPVAVAHSRELLADNPDATVIQQDLRRPTAVLSSPEVRSVIDFSQPVAVMMIAVMHFIPAEDDPAGIIATLREATVPGSYLALSHGFAPNRPADSVASAAGAAVYQQRTASPLTLRSFEEVTELFQGYELIEPGVVWVPQWHPDSPEDVGEQPERTGVIGGLGRRP